MKVILLQDVKKIGKRGEVKNVSDGFAHNFLLPKKLVKMADSSSIKQVEKQVSEKADSKASHSSRIKEQATELKDKSITIKAKAGSKDELFGGVGENNIKEAIKKSLGVEVRKIDLSKPIKNTGSHKVSVSLGEGVKTDINIEVEAE